MSNDKYDSEKSTMDDSERDLMEDTKNLDYSTDNPNELFSVNHTGRIVFDDDDDGELPPSMFEQHEEDITQAYLPINVLNRIRESVTLLFSQQQQDISSRGMTNVIKVMSWLLELREKLNTALENEELEMFNSINVDFIATIPADLIAYNQLVQINKDYKSNELDRTIDYIYNKRIVPKMDHIYELLNR